MTDSKIERPMTDVRTDDELRALLSGAKTIAMVGASANPSKPSYEIMKTLLAAGFTVIPVNPTETEVLGQRAYPSLDAIATPVHIVNVFRRSEQTPEIADAAVKIGARALWLQAGISNDEAARRARDGGLEVVMDECIGGTVTRLGLLQLKT